MHGRAKTTALLLLSVMLLCASCGGAGRFAYSGTLQSESARVGSTIGGRVTTVSVNSGQQVKKGQILVALDDSNQRAALAAAQSQQAQAQAVLADLEAGPRAQEVTRALAAEAQAKALLNKTPQDVSVAQDNVRQAQAALAQAQATSTQATLGYERAQTLFSQGAISAQARDDARANYQNAQGAISAAKARVSSASAQLTSTQQSDVAVAQHSYQSALANRQLVQAGARPQQVAQARAALNAAKANVAAAQSNLREMSVRAPADGTIDSMDLHPGDLVAPRALVAIVRETRDPFVRIYVAQHDLGVIKTGQRVQVRSDALGGEVFDGTVEQIDQDAQFTPRDVQTAEDRANLSYGVKVRVHDPDQKLHGGTTVEVATR